MAVRKLLKAASRNSHADYKRSNGSRTRAEIAALSREVAIDLGTATTQVVEQGTGLVLEEPTVVAFDRRTGEITDVGRGAIFLAERDPEVMELIWPVRSGAVDDQAALQRLFARLLRQFSGGITNRLRLVVSVSSCTTPNERRAVRDAAKRAGASTVQLIEHVIAAALGADLPIHEPVGTFVLDVGAGATEAALLSLGCVVKSSSVRSGGAAVDLAIKGVLRRQYGMIITDRTAEDIKLAVSSVPGGSDTLIEARGQMAIDGSTMTAILERSEVQSVVDSYVTQSVEAVRECLTGVSPELSQDMIARGLHLVGGGALLGGLAERLADEFNVPVHVMDEPDHAVVMGAAKCLEDQESLRRLFVGIDS